MAIPYPLPVSTPVTQNTDRLEHRLKSEGKSPILVWIESITLRSIQSSFQYFSKFIITIISTINIIIIIIIIIIVIIEF